MEDNQTLLMLVLKQHYKEKPKVLDDALQVIKEYSSEECNEQEYDKTLHILQEMMNDLPANILLYFLTMVPLPKLEHSCKSSLLDIIKKSQNPICDNIRPILLEYLNKNVQPLMVLEKKDKIFDPSIEVEITNKENEIHKKKDLIFVKPLKSVKLRQKPGIGKNKTKTNCKSLLDICALSIVENQEKLQKNYKKIKETAWQMVYDKSISGRKLHICYDVITDINKKEKWLRAIENLDITYEILYEIYGESELCIKEKNVAEELNDDPFVASPILLSSISTFANHCKV